VFVDEAKILVRGGHGGNGCVAFRRDKYVPRRGPSGGEAAGGCWSGGIPECREVHGKRVRNSVTVCMRMQQSEPKVSQIRC